MTIKRGMLVAALSAGIGLGGAFGAAVTVAQAAPEIAVNKPHQKDPEPKIPDDLDISHHDKRKLKEYLKDHPDQIPPEYR